MNLLQAVRQRLGPEYSQFQWAWVYHNSKIYLSQDQLESSVKPESAVTRLIQGLFRDHKDHSFFILRNRIFTNTPLRDFEKGMVKLAAKRISYVDSEGAAPEIRDEPVDFVHVNYDLRESLRSQEKEIRFASLLEVEDWLNLQTQLVPRGPVLHDNNRPIAAVLLNSRLEVLSFALAENSLNKTLHAEVLCLQSYWLQFQCAPPEDCVLLTTLKPCLMCAEMFAHLVSGAKNFRVICLQDDPGPKAKGSRLERQGLLEIKNR